MTDLVERAREAQALYEAHGVDGENGAALMADLARALLAAVELAGWVEAFIDLGCPKCRGDCSSSMPPVTFCPMQECMKDLAAFRKAMEQEK